MSYSFPPPGFPAIHASSVVHREVVNTHSLLYTISGSDATLKPYMICAHLDVVPAPPEDWNVPPFNATILDGVLYGRGVIDDKGALMVNVIWDGVRGGGGGWSVG